MEVQEFPIGQTFFVYKTALWSSLMWSRSDANELKVAQAVHVMAKSGETYGHPWYPSVM